MTDERTDTPPSSEDLSSDDQATRALLGRVLGSPPRLERSLLPSIQARIRRETHGRYFSSKRRIFRDPTLLLLGSAMLLLALAAAFLAFFGALFP
jgi:hypothetical protein